MAKKFLSWLIMGIVLLVTSAVTLFGAVIMSGVAHPCKPCKPATMKEKKLSCQPKKCDSVVSKDGKIYRFCATYCDQE